MWPPSLGLREAQPCRLPEICHHPNHNFIISQSPREILSSGDLMTVFKSYKRSGSVPTAGADTERLGLGAIGCDTSVSKRPACSAQGTPSLSSNVLSVSQNAPDDRLGVGAGRGEP